VLPDRSATPNPVTADKPSCPLGVSRTSSPSCRTHETEGELAMIRPEARDSRLLRKTANLLNSVAEAAWTNDIPSPAKWDLHRIGTEAYLAQREILEMLGLPGVIAVPQADFDIATALDQAAQIVAMIPEEFQTLVTQQLQEQVISLAQRAERAFALWHSIQFGYDGGPLSDHEQLHGGSVVDRHRTVPGGLGLPSSAGEDARKVASPEAGGVVTPAACRASCCWPPSSAIPHTPHGSRNRGDGSLVNNRSTTATPTAPDAA
jgi:hypothetical protein